MKNNSIYSRDVLQYNCEVLHYSSEVNIDRFLTVTVTIYI